jgi:hypothetical protein
MGFSPLSSANPSCLYGLFPGSHHGLSHRTSPSTLALEFNPSFNSFRCILFINGYLMSVKILYLVHSYSVPLPPSPSHIPFLLRLRGKVQRVIPLCCADRWDLLLEDLQPPSLDARTLLASYNSSHNTTLFFCST